MRFAFPGSPSLLSLVAISCGGGTDGETGSTPIADTATETDTGTDTETETETEPDFAPRDPSEFNGRGSRAAGRWEPIDNTASPAEASIDGATGFDASGYPTMETLWSRAAALGAFGFTRPRGLSTDPSDATRAVLASAGDLRFRPLPSSGNGADTVGTVYQIAVDLTTLTAELEIVYDGDEDGDRALRGPSGVLWSSGGELLVAESPVAFNMLGTGETFFGATAANPLDPTLVALTPAGGQPQVVAVLNRNALIDPTTEGDPVDITEGAFGAWEVSSLTDISRWFDQSASSRLLCAVQARALAGQAAFNPDSALETELLVAGGQLALLTRFGTNPSSPQMLVPLMPSQWGVRPLHTIGEFVGTYQPPGQLDGLGAYELDADTLRVLASHRLWSFAGYPYEVEDGSGGTFSLTGSRISAFDVDRATETITHAELAYDAIYDTDGERIVDASFLAPNAGLESFTSGTLLAPEAFGPGRGVADRLYLVGQEMASGASGQVWALDVASRALWAVPAMGRGARESFAQLDTGDSSTVAFLFSDNARPINLDKDKVFELAAPLYLYVGVKDPTGGFLERNGLADGSLYVWAAGRGSSRRFAAPPPGRPTP